MSRRARGPRILVFGENLNDSRSIKELILARNPVLVEQQIMALPKPVSLTREGRPAAVGRWIEDLSSAVRGHRANGPVSAVVVHRDADGPDPDGAAHDQLERQLAPLGAHPVVPVQTIEAWWFLFPDAVEAVRPTAWRGMMPRRGRDVETIVDPKSELQRLSRRGRAPEYSEADAPLIAAHVRRLSAGAIGTSRSYERLGDTARALV